MARLVMSSDAHMSRTMGVKTVAIAIGRGWDLLCRATFAFFSLGKPGPWQSQSSIFT